MRKPNGWLARILIAIVILYIAFLILLPVAAIFQGAFSKGVTAFLKH